MIHITFNTKIKFLLKVFQFPYQFYTSYFLRIILLLLYYYFCYFCYITSYFELLLLVGVDTMVCISRQNQCSSSKRTWMYLQALWWLSRYFVGERPSQPDMIWWMVPFSTRQIRHVSSSSTFKTCFLVYLVEISCSWTAVIVDSVDLFRVEDFSHWLDRSLSTWGWSRYFANCPCIFFLLSSASSLLIRADLMVIFRGNFFMGASCWISLPISSQYRCAFWWINFSRVTCQFDVSFRNCSSEITR